MNMHICTIRLLVVSLSCLSIAGAVPASCKPDWTIDWNRQPPDFSNFEPFSYPGEILPGVTVHDTLQFIGLLWNAPSWQEVMGRVCLHCGPFLHALYPEEEIRQTCDMILTSLKMGEKSDISGMCTSYLRKIEGESAARISRYHRYFRFNILPSDFERLGINLVFGLLKWLRPSLFSGDMFRACSNVRFLLSENIDETTVSKVKHLLTNVVVPVTLKELHRFGHGVCANKNHKVRRFLVRIQEDICDFLSKDHLFKVYIEKGTAFVEVLLSVPLNVELCTDVIGFLSSYDKFGATGYLITKRNFKYSSNRHQFCLEIVSAFTGTARTHSYIFPHNYDINSWYIFAEAGQILPDFSFMDAVNVFGAFIRSETFLDGGVVLCDVFESFLSKEFDSSVKGICTALRNGDTATVEKKCRSMFPPTEHSNTPTTESTVMLTIVTAVNMIAKLLDLPAITPEHVCSPLENFFYSKHNLQSVIRLGLNDFLADILPIANFACKNYDFILFTLKEKFDSDLFITFLLIGPELKDAILSHLGFSSQKQICRSIAAGVDTFSRRAKSSLITNMEDQFLKFLTDTGRCTASFKSLNKLFTTIAFHQKVDVYHGFSQCTGYLSITHLCETMSVMFDPDRCEGASSENTSSHSKDSLEENSSYCSLKNPFEPEIDVCMKIKP
ncbi:hypothetical protein HOLleu_19786 [Holothuria leucospilota]|uniref:Uncharacterized protein n=1 Tax=Holothuria leucospilota TaxID=206669 RepID=A0A9Q1BZS4_HOLLE|nr:hypothetical protein HOLleu_19786 [Holothuria leucospilota]